MRRASPRRSAVCLAHTRTTMQLWEIGICQASTRNPRSRRSAPEIQALIAAGAKADIEPAKRVGKLLTPVTPEAIVGHDRCVKGATAGMFLLPRGAEDFVLADPDKGFTFQAVGAFISFNEWPQERGGGAPIEMHPKRPADCHWLKPPIVAKEGDFRENGNRSRRRSTS